MGDIMALLNGINENAEDLQLASHGYRKIEKVCDALQGELFRAKIVSATTKNRALGVGAIVAIKKIDKELRKQKVATVDDMTYCVEEDIEKEAAILRHLTVDNTPSDKDVARFVELFTSETHLYLVTEYIDGYNLYQFAQMAFANIKARKLSYLEYRRCAQYILYKLFVTIEWLHGTYKCCHMDLEMRNVVVHGVSLKTDQTTGKM